MGPFIKKINETDVSKLPENGPWSFLRTYESPVIEETLEKISDRGKNDAKVGSRVLAVRWVLVLMRDVWKVRSKPI
jgi:hypothetical protein